MDRQVAGTEDDEALYAALAPQLVAFATGLVGRADAADVVAEAVVRVLGSSSWAAVSNRSAYLHRAVFNEAQTWLRRSSSRREKEARSAERDRWELPGFRPEVRAAVERLSVRQRGVVLLTYWADLDPAQVSEHLGISEGSVRRHLARARARLRTVLSE